MLADESAATIVEYAIVAAAFAVAMVAALAAIASECSSRLTATGTQLPALGTSPP